MHKRNEQNVERVTRDSYHGNTRCMLKKGRGLKSDVHVGRTYFKKLGRDLQPSHSSLRVYPNHRDVVNPFVCQS